MGIKAGVTQGSVLGPHLNTCDIPLLESNKIGKFANDTAIIAVGNNYTQSIEKFPAVQK